ncbi:MAG: hypothetical protein H7039_17830 [Bryobacteraceae bacterium]|nr:hypothetical protein [Bryobacteraceae bacterium]
MEPIQNNNHPSDQQIEEYAEGKLPTAQVAVISEHLFECDNCNEKYEQEAEFLVQMRSVKQAVAQEATAPETNQVPWWSKWLVAPSPWLATAVAAIALVFLVPNLTRSGTPVVAELTALRSATSVKAPADRPLNLRLDTMGVAELQQVRAEMADGSGNVVWKGPVTLKEGRWEAFVDRRMGSGQYWVRVYPVNGNETLREYSLELK